MKPKRKLLLMFDNGVNHALEYSSHREAFLTLMGFMAEAALGRARFNWIWLGE